MVNKYYILFFLFVMLLYGCGSSELAPEAYMAYCNDQTKELTQEREFNNIRYSLKHEPVEYKALKEIRDEGQKEDFSKFQEIRKEYDGLLYFVFKIENLDSPKSPIKSLVKNHDDLSRINQYCQSRLDGNFYAESNGIKVPCAIFHMEEDHSLMNFNLISFAFDKSKIDQNNDLTIVFDDPFFNTGTIKFNFSKKTFTGLPKLKLS